eukprot:946149-Amphidinium_carterae.2
MRQHRLGFGSAIGASVLLPKLKAGVVGIQVGEEILRNLLRPVQVGGVQPGLKRLSVLSRKGPRARGLRGGVQTPLVRRGCRAQRGLARTACLACNAASRTIMNSSTDWLSCELGIGVSPSSPNTTNMEAMS